MVQTIVPYFASLWCSFQRSWQRRWTVHIYRDIAINHACALWCIGCAVNSKSSGHRTPVQVFPRKKQIAGYLMPATMRPLKLLKVLAVEIYRYLNFPRITRTTRSRWWWGFSWISMGFPPPMSCFLETTWIITPWPLPWKNLKELYHLKKITFVPDRGLNSENNLEYLCEGGRNFMISYLLKRSSDAFKELVW